MNELDAAVIRSAVLMLEGEGHALAATVLAATRRLDPPAVGVRFGGRWRIWVAPAEGARASYTVIQEIKRALNAVAGLDASYVEVRTEDVPA